MQIFSDDLIEEYVDWQKANPNNFTWWSYVNMKADIKTALAFSKFFYAELMEIDGYILLKDNFDFDRYLGWKKFCKNDKNSIERVMNTYEVRDFFHINTDYDDDNIEEQIEALGEMLKFFWSLSFKQQFPNRNIVVELYEDEVLCITVFENVVEDTN
ncbi:MULTISPECIES: hypothetical protein [Clostridium]|uniref:hypothetical protein n=1 Tax=Clostridium TaxID=1485 RepID=UPI000826C90D|nr:MULTISPECIES: hypothetical protein [Clostridium]PJI07261.1 hypothetical protein CUB90_05015 [Clostridium sp. CT7]